MFHPSHGTVCLICNNTVLRRRHFTITKQLFKQNPIIARFIINNVGSDQIAFNNTEFICRPCYQRATRSSEGSLPIPSTSGTPDYHIHPSHTPTALQQVDAAPRQVDVQDVPATPHQFDIAAQGAPVALREVDVPAQDAPTAPRQVDGPAQDAPASPRLVDVPAQDAPAVPRAIDMPAIILPDVSRPPNSARICMVSGCQGHSLHRIPESQKISLMSVYNYYVPEFARICETHQQSNDWEAMTSAPNVMHSFNAEQVIDIMKMMNKAVEGASRFDFENIEQFDEGQLKYFTGRTREEFIRIREQTPSLFVTCSQPNTALGIMLMKLRTGEPDERLSLLFCMSRRNLERLMKSARDALSRDFVPVHLGWDNITREQIAQRNLQIPNALFGNADLSIADRKAVVICDGTYIYIHKSANFLFQIETYSPHKYHRNLLKAFMFVCSDGYIVEVTGPHGAKKSDASIMLDIITNENHPFHWQFRTDDVFILDRGFRDVVPDLEALGYEVHMPHSVRRGETQLTTLEANDSRKVTLIRWVVEIVNGRIKRDFKLFRQEFFHNPMPHMFDDLRIAAALTNYFHVPVTDNQYAAEIIQRINERQNMLNTLGEFIIRRRMNLQRVPFREMSADVPGFETFPSLTERELIIFALGSYQLKLAKSYYSEHVRGDGNFKISIYRDIEQLVAELNNAGIGGSNLWLLRGKIRSRYTRSKLYYTYILINEDESALNALNYYYCSCKAGNRTLGCCAHIMVILWFLSLARHEDSIHRPALFLDSIIIDEDEY